ncbi:hypothetical protein ANO14919_117150 [Xylariales sp. No.14919]|nr:hypothetical protein ANO14919_117150 [Xylariales sp. No.14919]
MFRKWIGHKGCTSFDFITAYINDFETYEKGLGEFSIRSAQTQLGSDPAWEERRILEGNVPTVGNHGA